MMWLVDHRRGVTHGVAVAGLLGLSVAGVALSLPSDALSPGTTPGTSTTPTQARGEQADTLDAATYLGVQRLRGELCMGRSDLAAMGCDTSTAATLLEHLVTTYETRRGDVIAARNAVLSTKTALRRAQREELNGDGDPDITSLRTLAEDYDQAVAAYQALLETLAGGMAKGLTEDQQALWSAARASERDGRPPELRYAVDMTEGQLEDMRNPGRDVHGERLGPIEAADLRLMQEASIEQARENHAARYGGVISAEEEALPLPPDLVEDEVGMFLGEPLDSPPGGEDPREAR